MDKERLYNLLLEYVNHTIQKEDYIRLMDTVVEAENDPDLYAFMKQIWDSQPVKESFTAFQSGLMYKRIITDPRFTGATAQISPELRKVRPAYKLWKIASAAVLLITMAVSVYFYLNTQHVFLNDNLAKHHIPPGKNNAVLTLSTGEQISLTDAANGQLADQKGVVITKTADGQLVYTVKKSSAPGQDNASQKYNTITTPRAGQYQVNLPDGTKVWINAASTLKFPAYFPSKGKREVELTGEAYFEVAHLKKQPFVVKTARQNVEVLGTHFNINSYDNEPFTKTTLLQGSVRVEPLSLSDARQNSTPEKIVVLQPGEESLLNTANQIITRPADTESAIAWKNGKFIFNTESLYSIMRKIERWYDVEVVYKGDFNGKTFDGVMSRFSTVSEVLRKFELTENVHFKIEGRRITVMP